MMMKSSGPWSMCAGLSERTPVLFPAAGYELREGSFCCGLSGRVCWPAAGEDGTPPGLSLRLTPGPAAAAHKFQP